MTKDIKKNKNQGINSNTKKQGGFKPGRNLATLFIVIGGLLLLFLAIFIPYSYITTYNANKITPFSEDSAYTEYVSKYESAKDNPKAPEKYNKVVRIKGKDFKYFDVVLKCTEYIDAITDKETNEVSSKGKAYFSLELKWKNDQIKDIKKVSKEINNESVMVESGLLPLYQHASRNVKAGLSLANGWVKSEQTSSSSLDLRVDRNGTTSFTVRDLPNYPLKANTWPIPVKVSAPSVYLYLEFSYNTSKLIDGKEIIDTVHEAYVLEYSFYDLIDSNTKGGIID